jgi:hypothetical protein
MPLILKANVFFQDESFASSTTSIGSSIMRHREENGRTYHAYKDGSKLPLLTFPTAMLIYSRVLVSQRRGE